MMNSGTNTKHVEQRSVVLVPFPFSDLSGIKKRPAFVISNNNFNKSNDDIICCLVTSNPHSKNSVGIKNSDMESGNLEFDSFVKPYRIFTINKSIIYKKLGKLNTEKSSLIEKELSKLIAVDY